MNILILGSGGREHAFAWKFKQSKRCGNLYIAPGNAGTSAIAENILLNILDFEAVGQFCASNEIEMLMVGPEEPLVKGVRDYFKKSDNLKHIIVVGPDQNGAQLEGSKDFSKQFMIKNGIPTAKAFIVTKANLDDGIKYIHEMKLPVVLKADGLAAGKGVLISETYEEAANGLIEMISQHKFGDAGNTVLIEEFLKGIELSVFVVADGMGNYTLLPEAKDYKRIGEGDTGLNTGGMGAVSPVPFADAAFMQKVTNEIIDPTIKGIYEAGMDYKGFVFIGIMNVDGNPYVIEYNCRMGDPETEVVLPRIESDLVELFIAMHHGELDKFQMQIDPRHCTTVMLVSGGYPDVYDKGKLMQGFENVKDVLPFHAGTLEQDGVIMTNGGRVLALSAYGNSIDEALNKSLKAAEQISYDKKYYRKDIGMDLM